MTVTQTTIKRTVHGDERVVHGAYTVIGGLTTAVLTHGLSKLQNMFVTTHGTVMGYKFDSSIQSGLTAPTVALTFGTVNPAGTFIAYGN